MNTSRWFSSTQLKHCFKYLFFVDFLGSGTGYLLDEARRIEREKLFHMVLWIFDKFSIVWHKGNIELGVCVAGVSLEHCVANFPSDLEKFWKITKVLTFTLANMLITFASWVIGFIACQSLLGYLILKSYCFFLQMIIWFQVTNNNPL